MKNFKAIQVKLNEVKKFIIVFLDWRAGSHNPSPPEIDTHLYFIVHFYFLFCFLWYDIKKDPKTEPLIEIKTVSLKIKDKLKTAAEPSGHLQRRRPWTVCLGQEVTCA